MYKSKLQELCQQRAWELPKYEATKQGVDHNPHFYATVAVNGVSFQSQSPSNTSKKAQNDAAKLAFDHFSLSRPSSTSNSSSGSSSVIHLQDSNQNLQGNGTAAVARNDNGFTDMQHLFKNQLQTYAQKRNLALPVYSCERVGPPHASRFKCKVTVNGQIYESEEYFPTLNKAEHAAAKAALMTLLPDGVEQDESGFKNLLQELAQKEGFSLPAYCTNRSGEAHMSVFVSTVEIAGEIFTGQTAKTKKQAEMSAAKVAYIALKQRNSSQSPAFLSPACQVDEAPRPPMLLSPSCQAQEALQSPPTCASLGQNGHEAPYLSSSSMRANLIAYLQQNVQPTFLVPDEQAEEDRECSGVTSHHSSISSPGLDSGSAMESVPSSSGAIISCSFKHNQSSSSLPCGSSASLATSSSIESLVGKSTSRHNRVIVHPRGTVVTYPAGTIVFPFSDDKWVAVQTPPQNE